MKAPEASVDRIARVATGTGSAPAGNVASRNEDNTTKAKRKRFVMFPPNRCDSRNSWGDDAWIGSFPSTIAKYG
jgi:hypothetical protein